MLTVADDRMDYGEVREISLGLVEGEPFLVVHKRRGEVTRIFCPLVASQRIALESYAPVRTRLPSALRATDKT